MVVRWFSKIITEVEVNGFALVNRYKMDEDPEDLLF